MTDAYLDTSARVKVLVVEPGTAEAVAARNGAGSDRRFPEALRGSPSGTRSRARPRSHLASALTALGPADVLSAWDRRLREGALGEGLAFAPAAWGPPTPDARGCGRRTPPIRLGSTPR